MPNGALIAIGVTALFGAYGFISAVPPGGTVSGAIISYIWAAFFFLIAIASFSPVVYRFIQNRRNRKYKNHKRKAAIPIKRENKQVPGDWYSNLQNFDLSRLTLAGWCLSLLSVIVFFIGAGIGASYLESTGVKQASKGQMKVIVIPVLAITVAFFYLGKWVLDKTNVDIYKD
jgi:hypothetical protein